VSAISNFCGKGVISDSAIYGAEGVIQFPLAAFRSTQQSAKNVLMYNALRKIRGNNPLKLKSRAWVEWTPPLFETAYPLVARWGAHIIEDILEFADCIIKNKEPSVATGKRARHVIEVFEKSYLSAKTGKSQGIKTTFA
jgi:predicted dehydrogenase